MSDVYAVAGQQIYIGSDPVDLPADGVVAQADFSGVTWVEIDGWQTMGTVGDAAALITTALINRTRDIKQKGTRNAGSMQNSFALDRTDAGQQKLREAEATDQNYPIRIVGNDEPAVGSAPTPAELLFYGLVMSAQEQGGQANTALLLQSTIEINTNIVTVAASAGAVPTNLTVPAISGTPQVGVVLTAWEGVWNNAESYTYQWQKDGVDIAAATAATYTPVAGDVGGALSVVVTATNAAGSASAESAATIAVIAA